MSDGEVLQHYSKQFFVCLQASYWERSDVETLACSLAEYVEYLRHKVTQLFLLMYSQIEK